MVHYQIYDIRKSGSVELVCKLLRISEYSLLQIPGFYLKTSRNKDTRVKRNMESQSHFVSEIVFNILY